MATRPGKEELLARNEAILRSRVAIEVSRGAHFLEARVGNLFGGLAGLFLNPVAAAAYRAVGRDEVVRRAQRQVDVLLAAARDHGERPEAIFDGHLTTYLRHDEAWARADHRHPRFPELEGLVREVYVCRVEPLSLLLHRGLGEDFDDLVRSVWPRRDAAERILERESLYSERLFALAHEERDLLSVPALVRRDVGAALRDAHGWYQGALRRSVDEVYGPAGA